MMDTSAERIKMCEMAVEVQGKHVRGNFDELFFHKDCVKMLPINGFGQEQILERHPEYNYKSDIRPKEWNDYCIWLPRQDELQAMVGNYGKCLGIMYRQLDDGSYIGELGDSMEQLWLAFVMKEKYQKTWNGEDWVDATPDS